MRKLKWYVHALAHDGIHFMSTSFERGSGKEIMFF